MATVVSVQADSRDECATLLAELCAAHGLTVVLPPMQGVGSERWMARATVSAVQGIDPRHSEA